MTTDRIDKARRILEAKWSAEGECGSCGWRACLYEHDVTDDDIEYALTKNGGYLELLCISKDDEDSYRHRGIKVNIASETNLIAPEASCLDSATDNCRIEFENAWPQHINDDKEWFCFSSGWTHCLIYLMDARNAKK